MMSRNDRLVVGLTGMSGAGKSTVCRIFADNGFEVIDCDGCAREIAERGMPALRELHDRLAPELILEDGSLDRRRTSEMIFHDHEKRSLFNKIIYPYITYNIADKLRSSGGFVLLDAPTLFEARLEFICGSIVSVIADTDLCVKRITVRDNIPRELSEARLKSQHNADFYRERSDYCLENNGTPQELYSAAGKVVNALKQGRS